MINRTIFNLINSRGGIYYIVCAYLAAAAVFSLFYCIILPLCEGAPALKHNSLAPQVSLVDDFFDCLYFSITSQTTVGYGDIVPATPGGKIVSTVQVVFGYFYLAFTISFLAARAVLKSDKFEKFLRTYSDNMLLH